MAKPLKIGIDIHGVADEVPDFFAAFSKTLVDAGHEVHIITGPPDGPRIRQEIERLGLSYTHFYSIVDHHKRAGTEMKQDPKGNFYLDDYLWDKTKAEYCLQNGIDLHLDDSDAYGYFFKTPYARFYSKNKRKYFRKED